MATTAPEPFRREYKNTSGMGAWLGTGVHHYLEHTVPFGTHELKLPVCHIEGYGQINGHIDFYEDGEVVDFKVVGKYSFDKMKLAHRLKPGVIPTTQYRVQQHTYGYALAQAGYPVTHVQLMVIPKMSNSFADIAFYREPYNEELALKAISRATMIWNDYVLQGKLDELPSDEDCYECDTYGRD